MERDQMWSWRRRWTWPWSLLTISAYLALALASFFGLSLVIRGMQQDSTARQVLELLQFLLFLPLMSGLAQGYWWVWRRVSRSWADRSGRGDRSDWSGDG
jgi:hypothetical protein